MKTKETSTRKQALIWWDSLSVWGNPSKEYYMGLYYSDDNVTPERIEEIWKNQVQIPALRNDEHNVEYLEKPNQKQYSQEELNPTTQVVRQAMKEVSKDVQKPKCVRDGLVKPNQKQFKQFDESLFKSYIDKFSNEDKIKALNILVCSISTIDNKFNSLLNQISNYK